MLVSALALAGCGGASRTDFGASPQATVAVVPDQGNNRKVRTDRPVTVQVDNGTLVGINVTDDVGQKLAGKVRSPGRTWTSTGPVTPDSDYTVEAVVRGENGLTSNFVRGFHTEKPEKVLQAEVTPTEDKVGVGMPIVVEFNTPITNKAGVEKRLIVDSEEPIEGSWHWFGDEEVHFRPENYWPANNRVDIDLQLRGAHSGTGHWGMKDIERTVTYGDAVVTKVDLHNHRAKTYINGDLERTIPVTGGMPGWRTRSGTKVVLEVRTGITFTDEQINAGENYNLYSAYGLRVTWSGEFVHSADWSSGSHGYANVSHGCVGMTTGHSRWLWKHSTVGDPMEFETSGSDMPVEGNGYGDWNMSWKKWKSGSALDGKPVEQEKPPKARTDRVSLTPTAGV